MQVLVSYTLNLRKDISKEELEYILEAESPMSVDDNTIYVVSTERWDIIEDNQCQQNSK